MDITTLSTAARRFPLLGRPRPACPSQSERVTEIAEIVCAAEAPGADGMAEAAHALNKTALLASDCGLTAYARDLCWQHIDVYRVARSRLSVLQARYMLEPVVNLARLQIRADAGGQALQLLKAMYQAVMANTDLAVDGRTLPLANLTGTRQEHHKLREWVWRQCLEDGIRALTLAGRWDAAVTHAQTYRGIGVHLMEGRQAAIVAPCLRGALQTARAMLQESTPTQPWEKQVASCLTVMCAGPNGGSSSRDIAMMVACFLGQEPVPGYAVFRARLGLTVVTLAGADSDVGDRVLARVATEVIEAGDGYAARDVLGYPDTSKSLTDAQREALSRLVICSGLGSGTLPEPLLNSLTNSVQVAKKTLAASM
ncbi:hypothetical protein [Streptosporangium sp. NPDC001681]|uniref:hypothetical protein n=1 Tax=Streptosporangium sp. NPDC001681 TaxID=3154395 RepID=UPI0033345F42